MYSFIMFRMDDICPQMDYEKFMRFKVLFDKHNIKPIIGVIPDNRDPKLKVAESKPDFWEMVKNLEANGWTIAQHGYNHLYTTKAKGLVALRNKSEFAGLAYDEQYDKIAKGMNIIKKHGINVNNIFMAPGHSFDKVTLKALYDCGFKYITDGRSRRPYEYMGLKFFPARNATPKLAKGLNTIYIHSNHTTDRLFSKFEQFVINNREYIIDFNKVVDLPPGKYIFCRFQEMCGIYYHKCLFSPAYKVFSAIRKLLRGSEIK